MKYLVVLGILLSFSAHASSLPVDAEIDGLRAKADQLEKLKNLFLNNQCQIQDGNNTVALTAGALRSQGLVMAIGPNFPGQYLAYHQAPKPEQLSNVVAYTLKKNEAGQGAEIVSAHLIAKDGSSTYNALEVKVAVPYLVPETEGLWMYNARVLRMSLPQNGESIVVSGDGPTKNRVRVSCN